ncbi:hypothetical protein CF149_19801 [Pseudomonas psychrophila]|nr:hypothetical protein CF149_19801 [Pseudomonas psychrophila]KMM99810.1 hypothetical protein TU76_11490 [Pseudomonas psychrophila]KOX62562.1 hypothetical protein AA303_24170 [Pseudomonas psychrophila]
MVLLLYRPCSHLIVDYAGDLDLEPHGNAGRCWRQSKHTFESPAKGFTIEVRTDRIKTPATYARRFKE